MRHTSFGKAALVRDGGLVVVGGVMLLNFKHCPGDAPKHHQDDRDEGGGVSLVDLEGQEDDEINV